MPPVENVEEEQEPAPAPRSVIGIIYPPPEVRNIVDKTASFVARNGPEFETRIRQNEINNPKFNFLTPTDPYHAYYQHKVKEFQEGKAQEPTLPKAMSGLGLQPQRPQEPHPLIPEPIIPKEPPPEFEFIADPPSISAFDLDVVKQTAQFVARNGRQFLTQLMNREQRNYQFDFLRPQHSLFNYFTKLVEQYTKILIPPKDLLPKLRRESEGAKIILDQVKYRVEWAKFQEQERLKEEEEKEKERVAYASIDWHDFVVVETVDFQPNEMGNLPPPTTPEEVGARIIAQERFEDNAEMEAVEMEVESSDDDSDGDGEDMEQDSGDEKSTDKAPEPPKPISAAPPPPPPPPKDAPLPPPLPPAPDNVIIRKNYDPKAPKVMDSQIPDDQWLVSPITGEKIPPNKIQEHIRRGLLDPKWIQQKERAISERKDQEEVYASGPAIGSSLKNLAERRTDIFGRGAEETQIGKKIGEQDTREKAKVIWDGHTASMEKVTQRARENITISEQIAVIHKVKGLVADEEKEKIGPAMPKEGAPHIPGMPKHPVSTMPSGMPSEKPMMSVPKPVAPPRPPQPGMPVPRPPTMVMVPRPPMMPPGSLQPVVGIQRPPMQPVLAPGPPMAVGRPAGFITQAVPPQVVPQAPVRPAPPPAEDDGPPSKKAKSEEALIPEAEFLAKSSGPVTFTVQVPKVPDKSEWKLNGQTVNLTLPLTDNVSVIKAKIHDALGMPAGKQKLQLEGLFIKDSNTLAFYNVAPTSCVQLQIKERGGRKK